MARTICGSWQLSGEREKYHSHCGEGNMKTASANGWLSEMWPLVAGYNQA